MLASMIYVGTEMSHVIASRTNTRRQASVDGPVHVVLMNNCDAINTLFGMDYATEEEGLNDTRRDRLQLRNKITSDRDRGCQSNQPCLGAFVNPGPCKISSPVSSPRSLHSSSLSLAPTNYSFDTLSSNTISGSDDHAIYSIVSSGVTFGFSLSLAQHAVRKAYIARLSVSRSCFPSMRLSASIASYSSTMSSSRSLHLRRRDEGTSSSIPWIVWLFHIFARPAC